MLLGAARVATMAASGERRKADVDEALAEIDLGANDPHEQRDEEREEGDEEQHDGQEEERSSGSRLNCKWNPRGGRRGRFTVCSAVDCCSSVPVVL